MKQQKEKLRQKLRKSLRKYENKFLEQKKLRSLLQEQLALYQPDLVLAFVPRSDEVDIWPVLQELSCELAFAKIVGHQLEFSLWPKSYGRLPDSKALLRGWTTLWRRHSRWDLIEPNFPSLTILSEQRVIMLCPGLGFFFQNNQIFRLGRGKGFYDRAIKEWRKSLIKNDLNIWGLGYNVQWNREVVCFYEPSCDQLLDGLFIAGQFYAAGNF